MANNKRVKLTADLIEAANEHGCKIPKDAIREILNNNKTVLRFSKDYVDASQPISVAKELIKRRKKAKAELY